MSDDRAPLLAGSARPVDADEEEDELVGDTPSRPRNDPTLQHRLNSLIARDKYTQTEKVLAGTSIILLVLLFVFVGLFARAKASNKDTQPPPPPVPPPSMPRNDSANDLCLTKECVITASQVLLDIDMTADPCQDFYSYTCGNWINSHQIPSDKSRIGSFDQLRDGNFKVLREILEGDFPDNHEAGDLPPQDNMVDRQNFEKLQAFYKACIDEDTIEELGAAPLSTLLEKIVELYPTDITPLELAEYIKLTNSQTDENTAVPNSNNTDGEIHLWKRQTSKGLVRPDHRNLTAALAEISSFGTDAFFGFGVDADSKNPDYNAVYLGQAGLGLPSKEYYSDKPDIIELYKEVISELLELVLDADKVSERIWEAQFTNMPNFKPQRYWNMVAGWVVDLETRLANISLSNEERNDVEATYNPRTMDELRALSPNIAWTNYLDTVIPRDTARPQVVILESPEYIEKLNDLLKNEEPQHIQYYLLWQTTLSNANQLSDDYQKPLRKLKAKLKGVSSKIIPERWETCVRIVDEALGQLAGRYFIAKSFGGNAKKMAEETFNAIKDAFVSNLPNLSWIDDETRAKAIEKIDAFVQKVGYSTSSPDVRSPVDLAEYYRAIKVDSKTFFDNLISTARWASDEMWSHVGQKVDRGKWLMTPQTVNAYYNPPLNEIVFPAGILQPPFFGAHIPEYLNYGAIGVVVGHELTHGFDNMGRLFDAKGRLIQWWSNATIDAFNDKAQCFIDEYSNFTMPTPSGEPIHINGKLTLGENLADNGGTKQAYQAWKKRFDSDPDGKKYINYILPGLEKLGRDKLYYINFGRIWCQRIRPEASVEDILTDPHSPARWRVNGVVRNSKHFAEIFGCPVGSPMNPESKCELW